MVENITTTEFDFARGELLLIDKPVGWTSFDVVNKIKFSLRPQRIKVGHAGTLDPLATGLLIICTGKFTKKLEGFQNEDKVYEGIITLGKTTPSYDLETPFDAEFPFEHLSEEKIREAAQGFVGVQMQTPPVHSAIKVDGERVYEKARRGEEVTLKQRQIEIKSFDITSIDGADIHFRIACTKGTYIRSIAHDFGKALDSGAHLSLLRRTVSGDLDVKNAWNLDGLITKIKALKDQA